MNVQRLLKIFFRENPLDKMSAPRIAYISELLDDNTEYQKMMEKTIDEKLGHEQRALLEKQQAEILNLETGEDIVRYIRHGVEILNCAVLSKKILSMQDEVIPLLLRRYLTSGQDVLIEVTMYVMLNRELDQKYVDQLLNDYPKIRNPYAQCMACVVFGKHRRGEALPLLLREYERFQREYPEESYCQGPLLAIYILFEMA